MKFYLALSLYIQVVKKKKKLVKVLVFKFFGQRFIWNLHFRISSKDLNRPKSGGNYGVPAKRDAIFVHWTLVRTPSCLYWKSASHHYLNHCIPFLKKKKKTKNTYSKWLCEYFNNNFNNNRVVSEYEILHKEILLKKEKEWECLDTSKQKV